MSYDPSSDAAAAQSLAACGQTFSLEASAGSGDSGDAWVGYESAFPFPMDELAHGDVLS